ncbi:MAG: acyl-ACP thioesterase [Desulfovibrio sp.]|jgi:acyl-ACP thioesterase|nr:acyl-ACP thioesterase [Desulfovibrio sp.]
MPTYAERFTVRPHETGRDGNLRLQCLCNYLEDAASAHAEKLGVGLDRLIAEDLTWALSRMRINILRRPRAGETLRVLTWPVNIERSLFRRDFLVFDRAREVIGTALTQWVVINLKTRRLAHFPVSVSALEQKRPRCADKGGDIRIPALGEEAEPGPSFPVRLADIDRNLHVNNGRFVDFILESAAGLFPDEAVPEAFLTRLETIFRAEGLRGDTIRGKFRREDPAKDPEAAIVMDGFSLVHSLRRESDGKELARARTVFDRAQLPVDGKY